MDLGIFFFFHYSLRLRWGGDGWDDAFFRFTTSRLKLHQTVGWTVKRSSASLPTYEAILFYRVITLQWEKWPWEEEHTLGRGSFWVMYYELTNASYQRAKFTDFCFKSHSLHKKVDEFLIPAYQSSYYDCISIQGSRNRVLVDCNAQSPSDGHYLNKCRHNFSHFYTQPHMHIYASIY